MKITRKGKRLLTIALIFAMLVSMLPSGVMPVYSAGVEQSGAEDTDKHPDTGKLVKPLDFGYTQAYTDPSNWATGVYVSSNWYPERLVIQHDTDNGADVSSYLADNYGNRVSQDYQLITPLIWKDGKGVYMTERSVARFGRSAENFGSDPDGAIEGWSLDPTWRCGLIDQDGNVIAEEKYVSIQILSMDRIRLGCEGGTFEEIAL